MANGYTISSEGAAYVVHIMFTTTHAFILQVRSLEDIYGDLVSASRH